MQKHFGNYKALHKQQDHNKKGDYDHLAEINKWFRNLAGFSSYAQLTKVSSQGQMRGKSQLYNPVINQRRHETHF